MKTLHQQITGVLRANKFDSRICTPRRIRPGYEVSKFGGKVYLFTCDYFSTDREEEMIKAISEKGFNIEKSTEGAEDLYIITR